MQKKKKGDLHIYIYIYIYYADEHSPLQDLSPAKLRRMDPEVTSVIHDGVSTNLRDCYCCRCCCSCCCYCVELVVVVVVVIVVIVIVILLIIIVVVVDVVLCSVFLNSFASMIIISISSSDPIRRSLVSSRALSHQPPTRSRSVHLPFSSSFLTSLPASVPFPFSLNVYNSSSVRISLLVNLINLL
mgnify:CR=1 FL=1